MNMKQKLMKYGAVVFVIVLLVKFVGIDTLWAFLSFTGTGRQIQEIQASQQEAHRQWLVRRQAMGQGQGQGQGQQGGSGNGSK